MWSNLNNKKDNTGFTLIEVLVAVFIIGAGLAGSLSLISQNVFFIQVNSSQLIATYLAQEGVEIVKNIRDTNFLKGENWDSGLVSCGGGCQASYDDEMLFLKNEDLKINNFYQHEGGTSTFFKRKIIVEVYGDLMEVAVKVSWVERGRDYEVVVRENVYKWW